MLKHSNKFDKDEIKKTLRAFFRKQDEVLVAYLFGSVAEDKQNKLSDLDVAILVDSNKLKRLEKQQFGYQVSVMTDLMSLLKTNDIDLVILNYATPLLSHEVIKSGEIVFCRDEDDRAEFEIRTQHRYLDTKHLREIQDSYFKERVKKGFIAKV
ncbi:MAG: nucleotidyltransferase domain-containing protein [bacterium]